MSFKSTSLYNVMPLTSSHKYWAEIQTILDKKNKYGAPKLTLTELYDVRWKNKPFPWSYFKEFRPNRRWFYHGTSKATMEKILSNGFQVGGKGCTQLNGGMLGKGVYATYNTNKGKIFAPDGYMFSVMVYTPKRLVIQPQNTIKKNEIVSAPGKYDAIEVRTGAIVDNPNPPQFTKPWVMKNHEICVFDTRRIIPRFILKVK